MTPTPLVSVLVPLHNKAPWIASTIHSALDQTYPQIEVVVIDDGSTDGSGERVAALNDPRIRLLRRENRGANATRNELLDHAQGEFIQFLDADDLLAPNKIRLQVDGLLAGADVSCCAVQVQSRKGTSTVQQIVSASASFPALVGRGLLTVSPLHRKCSLVAVGGWDEALPASQEFDLHLRLAVGGLWARKHQLDEPLATWRDVPGSTSGDERRLYRSKLTVLQRLVPDINADDTAHLALAIVNTSRHLARQGLFDEALDALEFAAGLDPSSINDFPPRIRRVPTARLKLRAEWADFRIRRYLGALR